MLAATIGIQAGIETQVWAGIFRDERLRVVMVEFRPWGMWNGLWVAGEFVQIITILRQVKRGKGILWIGRCAPAVRVQRGTRRRGWIGWFQCRERYVSSGGSSAEL